TAGARGDEGGKGDQIHLQREMWLDFDGGGLRTADHLSGELRHHQRLDVTAPWQLQRASEGGTPLLVSKGGDGRSGVELRTRKLDLDAGLRLPVHGGAIPSSGWRLPLEGISASLHLPFGYRLIAAPGADRAPDTWVAQWNLLDLFVLALVALLAGRLLGWRWAVLAALYLALGRHESGARLCHRGVRARRAVEPAVRRAAIAVRTASAVGGRAVRARGVCRCDVRAEAQEGSAAASGIGFRQRR